LSKISLLFIYSNRRNSL